MDWRQIATEFAETVGMESDRRGHAPMEGRIIGWLLMCEPPYQSAAELAEALQASKSTISTATRRLLQRGMLEKVSLPGVRRSYYQLRHTNFPQMAAEIFEGIRAVRELTERGLQMVAWREPAKNERLQFMRDFHVFLERELPSLLERWAEEWGADQ